jgi:hypothetical protein
VIEIGHEFKFESPRPAICPVLIVSSQGKEILNDRGISRQKLVLGTHTSENEQNYLMIAEVTLPLEDSELDAREYDEEKKEVRASVQSAGERLT